MPLTYRPDIDGLRTIAVFSVVLFHLGVPWVPGGFVGVDIFFVISGYLITALLEKDHGQGGISFATFYARRAKRLLPAGFAVFLFALAVGWFLYGTEDYSELALSVAAASVFFANFHFADRTDYFDAPAQDHPLLHTWSLSVEEQFYFVWPLLLIVLLRYRHKPIILFGVPAALFVASLASSIWMTAQSPGAAFFYLPSRFWELLLGAVLALYRHRVNLSAPLASLSGMTGLGLIIYSILTISEHDPFPGAIALLPCFGTALLILSGLGPASLTSRLLSTRVMVWGGLISYSLYLWHWPFIVFWRQSQNVQALDLPAMAGLLVASVITATLSYRFVEQPIRRLSAARLPNKRALKLAGASTLAIGLGGLALHLTDGAPSRLPDDVLAIEAKMKMHHPSFTECHGRKNLTKGDDECGLGPSGPIEVLLTGDSHAGHLVPTIEQFAIAQNMRARQLAQNACPPLLGAKPHHVHGQDYCAPYRTALTSYLNTHPELKIVFITSRWASYTQEQRIDGNSKIPGRITLGGTDLPSIETSRALLQQHLTGFVDQLVGRGLKVVLVGQVPPHALNPNYCLLRTMRAGRANVDACGIESARAQKHLAYSNQMLQAIAADRPDVYAVLPSAHLCAGRYCKTMLNDEPLYKDYNHLTAGGAAALYDLLPFDALSF